MRACKNCGLSIGDRATFCPVCGVLAEPEQVAPPSEPEAAPEPAEPPAAAPPAPEPAEAAAPTPVCVADLEAGARACEKTDPARAATLYRQAIVERLDSGDDLLTDRSVRRDVQGLFDRLSLVLKRAGLPDEALEEIDTAAYLGLVDDTTCGTKTQREALAKRRDTLRQSLRRNGGG